jgi:hypothetical protein
MLLGLPHLEVAGWGGIYSHQPNCSCWEGCCRWAHRKVRCTTGHCPMCQPCHPTVRVLTVSTVGALSSCGTGQSGAAPDSHCSLSGAPSMAALTLRELSAHCSAFAGIRCSRPLRWSHCSAGAPDSPVAHRTVRWHTGQSGEL